ncbi:MAG TPA: ATP synthase F1 subunit delta [Candidatus Saccharimonadales bacterium]|nr:ATP synthase F1 subunit delta [Candidatus Saccharimonadales bacterium]
MKISVSQYAAALFDLVADKSEKEVTAIIKSFVSVLDKNHDFNKTEAIITSFNEIWNKANSEVDATLSSARELSATTRETVTNYLKHKTGAKKIILETEINPKIIGGFVLRYGSKVLDGSLRNSLNSLKNKISN